MTATWVLLSAVSHTPGLTASAPHILSAKQACWQPVSVVMLRLLRRCSLLMRPRPTSTNCSDCTMHPDVFVACVVGSDGAVITVAAAGIGVISVVLVLAAGVAMVGGAVSTVTAADMLAECVTVADAVGNPTASVLAVAICVTAPTLVRLRALELVIAAVGTGEDAEAPLVVVNGAFVVVLEVLAGDVLVLVVYVVMAVSWVAVATVVDTGAVDLAAIVFLSNTAVVAAVTNVLLDGKAGSCGVAVEVATVLVDVVPVLAVAFMLLAVLTAVTVVLLVATVEADKVATLVDIADALTAGAEGIASPDIVPGNTVAPVAVRVVAIVVGVGVACAGSIALVGVVGDGTNGVVVDAVVVE